MCSNDTYFHCIYVYRSVSERCHGVMLRVTLLAVGCYLSLFVCAWQSTTYWNTFTLYSTHKIALSSNPQEPQAVIYCFAVFYLLVFFCLLSTRSQVFECWYYTILDFLITNDETWLLISRHQHNFFVDACVQLQQERLGFSSRLLWTFCWRPTLFKHVRTWTISTTGTPFSSTWWKT